VRDTARGLSDASGPESDCGRVGVAAAPFTPSERSAHMAKRILVAVDGSTEARDALAFAASEWPDAELTALHVINPADSATGADGGFPGAADQWYDSAKQRGERILTEATAAVDRDIETRLEVGRPTATILGVAGGEAGRRRRRPGRAVRPRRVSESGSDRTLPSPTRKRRRGRGPSLRGARHRRSVRPPESITLPRTPPRSPRRRSSTPPRRGPTARVARTRSRPR